MQSFIFSRVHEPHISSWKRTRGKKAPGNFLFLLDKPVRVGCSILVSKIQEFVKAFKRIFSSRERESGGEEGEGEKTKMKYISSS